MHKDLGIVICNFNKVDYLKGCLETLYKSNFENLSYDVIVVDNASTDESVDFVKDNYKEVILLENATNTGGSGGFDRGIRYCEEKSYEYVVLLDNDILLEENTIINLVNYIKVNPKVGVVGSKICTMDNPDILQEMGSFIDLKKNFNVKTPLKSHFDNEKLPDVVVCDYVPACCLITTNEVLKKVGSFNTDHFIYWDDMDWCTRVKKAGFEVHAINSSRVFHKMGSNNNTNTFGMYYYHRNRILFFLKYLKEEDFKYFQKHISEWLSSLTFFCNEKEDYNAAKVAWLILDDLMVNNLGRQDERVLERKNEKLSKLINKKIYIDKKAINQNKESRIITYLEELNLDIYIQENILDKEIDNNSYILMEVDHILEIEHSENISNIIYIDNYLNILFGNEVDSFETFHKNYLNMFENIFSPIIYEKLEFIRELYREHSNN